MSFHLKLFIFALFINAAYLKAIGASRHVRFSSIGVEKKHAPKTHIARSVLKKREPRSRFEVGDIFLHPHNTKAFCAAVQNESERLGKKELLVFLNEAATALKKSHRVFGTPFIFSGDKKSLANTLAFAVLTNLPNYAAFLPREFPTEPAVIELEPAWTTLRNAIDSVLQKQSLEANQLLLMVCRVVEKSRNKSFKGNA